jgi:phosphoribosylaminoimidazolecarboxamide formyltransferase/IMP cyclohydrolase
MKALISVSNKENLLPFAKGLMELGWEIVSTGGTYQRLQENGIEVTGISELTGFPECLEGRVKTLHPKVHGGILAKRENESHQQQARNLGIEMIDMVVVNLYPFRETVLKPGVTLEEVIENIDIGGPTMLRSAGKNYQDVLVLCDPEDYKWVLEKLQKGEKLEMEERYRLAWKVFQHTAAYDALISEYLRRKAGLPLSSHPTFTYDLKQQLRYGENPHQKAWYYREPLASSGDLTEAVQLHGKELSFNNINDTEGALKTLREFVEPAAVAVKHANPCGVATGSTIMEAYMSAYNGDPISIFGGILALNREVDAETAAKINEIFIEIVLAPGFTEAALGILTQKKNIRLLKLDDFQLEESQAFDMKKVSGGLLVQEEDGILYNRNEWRVVTEREPSAEEIRGLEFAMKVAKHVKSNGIVVAKENRTLGIGPGQVNRIWAVEHALNRAVESTRGAVLASDAFFPFEDCVEKAGEAGITAIIQPGGSMNDQDSIEKANKLGIAMIFTGTRHFKH